jgi:hypothetical protein
MPVVGQSAASPPPSQPPGGGREPKASRRALEISTLDTKHDFVFICHPLRWDVYLTEQGAEILPAITELEFQPGLAGVLPVKGEMNGDPSYAITAKVSKGWVVVPEDFEVTAFGERRRGYRHVYDGRGGPDSHVCSVWQRPYQVGGQAFVQRDEAGFLQFLRDIAAKIMPPIDPNARRALESKLREMHRTAASARSKSYMAESVAELLERKLVAFARPDIAAPSTRAGRAPKAAPRATPGDEDA